LKIGTETVLERNFQNDRKGKFSYRISVYVPLKKNYEVLDLLPSLLKVKSIPQIPLPD
jgi:hypothetical protein